ncbi:MAG TPA: hypothetical protein VN457_06990, partial [Chlamydiales bacterium]|nr:hypothetical protein [Chlamydiales bacterium]
MAFESLLIATQVTTSPLIPREALFQQPSCMAVKLSPNGQRMASISANKDGAMNVCVSDDLTLPTKQLTHFHDPKIKMFYWSSDSTKIFFLKDTDGKDRHHLYWLDTQSGKLKNLTEKYGTINAKFFAVSHHTNKAVIGITTSSPQFYDLFLLNTDDSTLTELLKNDRYI